MVTLISQESKKSNASISHQKNKKYHMIYLGIDPGLLSGAWGIIDHHGKYVACGDIPEKDGRIVTRQFWSDLSLAIDNQDCEIWCEAVHSMPKQGLASTYKFGRAVGAIEAVCERFLYPWHLVTPQAWKKNLGLSSDKQLSLDMARELFPEAPLKRKKDHGRAEALLLAEYGRRQGD